MRAGCECAAPAHASITTTITTTATPTITTTTANTAAATTTTTTTTTTIAAATASICIECSGTPRTASGGNEPLFSVAPVLLKVEFELKTKHRPETRLMLKDARAYLLCMEGKYEEALRVFTDEPEARDPLNFNFDVFKLIDEHELFHSVASQKAMFALLTTHEAKVGG